MMNDRSNFNKNFKNYSTDYNNFKIMRVSIINFFDVITSFFTYFAIFCKILCIITPKIIYVILYGQTLFYTIYCSFDTASVIFELLIYIN